MTKTQVRSDFALIQRFMVNDLERGIRDAQANYLVALGLFAYLEVVGGWISGDGATRDKSRSNFDAAVAKMDQAYQTLNAAIQVTDASGKVHPSLYSVVRCGLVHEYSPKGKVIVKSRPRGRPKAGRIGIAVVPDSSGGFILEILTNELLRDFKKLVRMIRASVDAGDTTYYPNVKTVFERMEAYQIST